MDLSILRNRALEFKNILSTVTKLQKNNSYPEPNSEAITIARGIVLLLLAVLLAWVSKTETESNTRNRLLQNEWPETQVLHSILTQGGWTLTKTDLSNALRNHPDPFSSESMLWESDDHCMILLTQASEPQLWSCATSHSKINPRLKWRKIGSGYAGVNKLAQIELPKVKKTVSYIDPKEIRY